MLPPGRFMQNLQFLGSKCAPGPRTTKAVCDTPQVKCANSSGTEPSPEERVRNESPSAILPTGKHPGSMEVLSSPSGGVADKDPDGDSPAGSSHLAPGCRLWHVNGIGDLLAFFWPLLLAIVACQGLVVVILRERLPAASTLALSGLFIGMLYLDFLALRPLMGRHHREFLPRLFVHLVASASLALMSEAIHPMQGLPHPSPADPGRL